MEPDLKLVIIPLLKIKDNLTIEEQLSSKEIMCQAETHPGPDFV
jgi:hypothetical protein